MADCTNLLDLTHRQPIDDLCYAPSFGRQGLRPAPRRRGLLADLGAPLPGCGGGDTKLRGRIMLDGAFQSHPITIVGNVMRENPQYVRFDEFMRQLNAKAPLT